MVKESDILRVGIFSASEKDLLWDADASYLDFLSAEALHKHNDFLTALRWRKRDFNSILALTENKHVK